MSELEQVSKEMMDELNSLRHNYKLKKFGTIVGLMNDVLEEEHLTEHLAYLGHSQKFEQAIIDYVVWNKDLFEAEKWTNPQTEVVEVEV